MDNTKYPSYSGIKTLPDTIFLLRENVILISNFSRADKAEITIYADNGFQSSQSTRKSVDKPGLVKFEMTDLFPILLSNAYYVKIEIKLFKEHYERIGNRDFAFRTVMTFISNSIPINTS